MLYKERKYEMVTKMDSSIRKNIQGIKEIIVADRGEEGNR